MKSYKKPVIYIERFELSQSVAACGWDMNSIDKNSCEAYSDPTIVGGVDAGDMGILFTSSDRCTITDYEQYCYEVGTGSESMKVFTS